MCLNALSCCHVIGWLDDCEQLNGCTQWCRWWVYIKVYGTLDCLFSGNGAQPVALDSRFSSRMWYFTVYLQVLQHASERREVLPIVRLVDVGQASADFDVWSWPEESPSLQALVLHCLPNLQRQQSTQKHFIDICCSYALIPPNDWSYISLHEVKHFLSALQKTLFMCCASFIHFIKSLCGVFCIIAIFRLQNKVNWVKLIRPHAGVLVRVVWAADPSQGLKWYHQLPTTNHWISYNMSHFQIKMSKND